MQDPHNPDSQDRPDDLDTLLRRIEAAMHAQHSAPNDHREQGAGTGQSEQQDPPFVVVYIVDTPLLTPSSLASLDESGISENAWAGSIIESTLESATGDFPHWHEDAIDVDVPPPMAEQTPEPRRWQKRTVGLLVALASLALIGLVLVALFVVPPLTASASITILPTQTTVTATTTLTVVTTDTPSLQPGQVPGRLLSSLTVTGQRTVPTTGTGHQDAAAAHGMVTFYNAALSAQTIPAGTLLTGSDGVQVVTDEDAVIPAGTLATNGQTTVPAHAVPIGPGGNIAAGDIYGPCCRADVLVQNATAFRGGQSARTYHMVAAQDVDTTASTLKTTLAQSVQAAFAAQVRPDETLITPVACTPQVTTSHAIGAEAAQVTVQLTETCSGETYHTQAVQTQVEQTVTHAALQQVGTGNTQEGGVQVSVQHVTVNTGPHGGVTLQVKGTGQWAYQFTDAQLHTLAARLAGKSRAEATAILLDTVGVSQVAMNVSGLTGTLPPNPSRIQMLVLYQP